MAPGSHLIGSSRGFLFSVSSSSTARTLDIRVVNPLTGASLSLPPAPAHLDPKDCKLTLSPSLDKALLLHPDDLKAEFASPSSSSSWIPLPISEEMRLRVHDCIFHKRRLFMVDSYGTVAIFDEHYFDNPSASSAPLVLPAHEKNIASNHILVESPDGDDLYLLFHYRDHSRSPCCYETASFMVLKLDEHDHRMWKEVKSIGDLAMFVGRGQAISLIANNFPMSSTS